MLSSSRGARYSADLSIVRYFQCFATYKFRFNLISNIVNHFFWEVRSNGSASILVTVYYKQIIRPIFFLVSINNISLIFFPLNWINQENSNTNTVELNLNFRFIVLDVMYFVFVFRCRFLCKSYSLPLGSLFSQHIVRYVKHCELKRWSLYWNIFQ